MTMTVFHFAADALRDGSALPCKGDALPRRKAVLCESGWHGSANILDALSYAPGTNLCLRELRGTIVTGDDKACGSEAGQATDYVDVRPLLVEFTHWCADRAREHSAYAARAYAARAARAYAARAARAAAADAARAARAAARAYAARAAIRAGAVVARAARAAAARAADAAYAAARAAYAAAEAAEHEAQRAWLEPRALEMLNPE